VSKAQQALEDRKLVERAKGLLMSALKLSEQDAFRRLQLTARERNLRLAEVARRVVEQQSLLEPKPESPASSR
jgi:response regulator NasT